VSDVLTQRFVVQHAIHLFERFHRAIRHPVKLTAAVILKACGRTASRRRPVSRSQNRTHPSRPPVTRDRPSGPSARLTASRLP
jgi:hypothetical protein